MKIQIKIFLVIFLLILITGTINIVISRIIAMNIIKEGICNSLETIAESRANHIKTIINEYKQTVEMLAIGIPFTNALDLSKDYTKRIEEANIRINRTIDNQNKISRIRILDKNGIVIVSSDNDIGLDMSTNETFLRGKENTYIGDVHFSKFTDNLVMNIASPIVSSIASPLLVNGELLGVLIINFNVEKELFEIITDETGLQKTGEIYLVNKDGYMITPSRFIDNVPLKQHIYTGHNFEIDKDFYTDEHKAEILLCKNYLGVEVIRVHTHILEMQWCLISEISTKEAFAPINKLTNIMFSISIMLLIVGTILSIFLSKTITKPLLKLYQGTEEIMKGNLTYKVGTQAKDEIGQLSRAFDKMSSNLKQFRGKLEKYNIELAEMVEAKTMELREQFKKSEKQRIAIQNILYDFNEANKNLELEIKEREYAEEQVKHILFQQVTVNNLALTLGEFNDIDKIYHTIYKHIEALMSVNAFIISFYDIETQLIYAGYMVSKNRIIDVTDFPPIPLEEPECGTQSQVIRTGRAYYFPDWRKAMDKTKTEYKISEDTGTLSKEAPPPEKQKTSVNSVLLAPMKIAGEVIGVMQIQNHKLDAYNQDDMQLLSSIANVSAIAIQNNKLLSDLRLTNLELAKGQTLLTQKVEERTAELVNINLQLQSEVDERKKVQTALLKAKENAEIANHAKSKFLANMSHELRTPLNAILGYAKLLNNAENLTELQVEGFNIIYNSGEHLLDLINDILDLSKIEAGRMELHLSEIHLPKFLKQITDLIWISTKQKGISFIYEIASDLPVNVLADKKRLREILINLLDNAVKFTKEGNVIFKIYYQDNKIHFYIEDTGIGIETDKLEEIFLPFQQVGEEGRFSEGTGLGLAICYKLVKMMGSELKVESIIDKGSIFEFALKLAEVSGFTSQINNDERKIIGYKNKRQSILIVDDKKSNRKLLVNMLSPLGFELIEADNGEKCLSNAIENKSDIILLDLWMPDGINGFEVTKQIRKLEELHNIIIIAVSASAFSETRKKSLEAGCDDFLPKPIELEKLLSLLQKYLNLEWTYEEIKEKTIIEPQVTQTLLSLPQEETKMLLELALSGDIKGIREELKRIESLGEEFLPIIIEFNKLAKEFQINKIIELLENGGKDGKK